MRVAASSLVLSFLSSLVLAQSPVKYSYWIEPCDSPGLECEKKDPQLAQWAFETWQRAAEGGIRFASVKERELAQIRLVWASEQQGMYGEARPIMVAGKRGAEVYVRPAPMRPSGDHLLRDAIVYLTCLHETGHAIGLMHTSAFEDIMYSFQYGGDITEYFARYRRLLKIREDIPSNSGLSPADRAQLKETLRISSITNHQ